jgi:N-acetylglucosaminyl-diphospho-decaprenol L-rhamnosyltransferase
MLSVVVVSFNSGALLIDCLASVLQSVDVSKLILVDNASDDGSISLAYQHFSHDDRLLVIEREANSGFATAANEGAVHAQTPWLMFLNPDCLLSAKAIADLLRSACATPTLGALGALMIYPNGELQPASLRRHPTPLRALLTVLKVEKLITAGGVHIPLPKQIGVVDVEACSGALMLLPSSTIATVGAFDSDYFLHCEDLDLCRRILRAGLRVCVDTSVRVPHRKGSSSLREPLAVARFKHLGMLRYFRKFDAPSHSSLLCRVIEFGAWMRWLLLRSAFGVKAIFAKH